MSKDKTLRSLRKLPLLPVKDLVVFPHIFTPIGVGRDFSKNAVFNSIDKCDHNILITLQKNGKNEKPAGLEDFYPYGVLCKIIKFEENIVNKTNVYKILVKGIERVKLSEVTNENKCFYGEYETIKNLELDVKDGENKILYETLVKDLIHIIEKGFIKDAVLPMNELDNPIATCYLFLAITKDHKENQKLLECNNARELVTETYNEIIKQKNLLKVKEDIVEQAKDSMSESQKQYFLREQIKAIKKELGDDQESDVDHYTSKYAEIEKYLTESNKKEILKNLKKLKNASSETYEVSVVKNYLDYVFDLPWYEVSDENLDIKKAKVILDKRHCYLDEVKERILEFLAVRKLNTHSKAPIICFVGPPGTGKTSFAQSLAEALGRESVRISLGGVKDESEIRGHRKTYVGSMPGKIMQGMRQAGTRNPVFVLDEIDKLSNDFRGDPTSALLEVLDPEQNNTFRDHYINLEYDLSKVMFICTANFLEAVPAPLRDRLEIMKVTGYCEEEKIEIAKKFLIPKKAKEGGIGDKEVSFSSTLLKEIIRNYTKEFGVRELERQIFKIIRKVARKKAEKSLKSKIKLTKKNLPSYLGVSYYSTVEDNKNDVGVVTGLAYTSHGGEILKLECIHLEEEGEPILTGRLGEVMQESAKIGLSIIKNNRKKWDIDENMLKQKIHIHAPAGAVPKDGPSAGVALVSCMVSLLKNKKVKDSVAMTGEVTLTGKVWPVGGIKEKVLAAIRSNIKTVILPKDNMKDFEDIPKYLTEKIQPVYISNVNDVFKEIF